ncbi:hypothetical protein AB4084_25775, partial [Lysobacter sp. 2RAB21]
RSTMLIRNRTHYAVAAALVAALALAAAPMHLSPLVLGAATTAVLMIVAGWETASMRYSEAELKH